MTEHWAFGPHHGQRSLGKDAGNICDALRFALQRLCFGNVRVGYWAAWVTTRTYIATCEPLRTFLTLRNYNRWAPGNEIADA